MVVDTVEEVKGTRKDEIQRGGQQEGKRCAAKRKKL